MTYLTDVSIGVQELARALEDAGFESMWAGEHSHIPLNPGMPFPPDGSELPDYVPRLIDPFVSLAAAAAVTKTLNLGTGICLVSQRDPIQLAKEVATLDLISEGRFVLGVGYGNNLAELENHGTDPSTRFTLVRERIEAMKQIWTNEVAEYHGTLVDFGPLYSWPKPVQQPHPPVLLGSMGPLALRNVVAFADGWMPHYASRPHARIPELQRLAAEAGRGRMQITIVRVPPRPEVIEELIELGVDRATFRMSVGPDEETLSRAGVLQRVDQIGKLISRYT